MNMRPNWELKQCCNHEQVVFLVTVSVCTVVILALWRTSLLKPFKLVTVFLHEASHAIACKLTCGKVRSKTFYNVKILFLKMKCAIYIINVLIYISVQVEGIQVHADEDLGSSFWGMLLILASTTLLTARIAAGCLVAALLVVLLVAKNWTLRGLCIGFVIFLGVIWVLQETTDIRILRYIILFIGKCNSALFLSVLFSEVYCNASCVSDEESQLNNCRCDEQLVFSSGYDIYDDLISRRVHSSDAEKFAEVCPCPCNGIGWGIIWGLISFFFLCGAMYFGLVILS
ncbi:hypothetical protein WN943_014309 [Citrus x changshan-huyou]